MNDFLKLGYQITRSNQSKELTKPTQLIKYMSN